MGARGSRGGRRKTPATVFALSMRSVRRRVFYRSDDGGATWPRIAHGTRAPDEAAPAAAQAAAQTAAPGRVGRRGRPGRHPQPPHGGPCRGRRLGTAAAGRSTTTRIIVDPYRPDTIYSMNVKSSAARTAQDLAPRERENYPGNSLNVHVDTTT